MQIFEAAMIFGATNLQLIDSGSVADWVSGIGTLIAIGAALWIAGNEQRHARSARELEGCEKKARIKQICEEAVRLSEGIVKHCDTLLSDRKEIAAKLERSEAIDDGQNDPVLLTARGFYCIHEIAGLRQQVLALQSLGVDHPRAFIEISRMGYEADISYPRTIDHRKVSTSELMRVKHDMKLRADALGEVIQLMN